MSFRFDVERYHKPLSVLCFGGITLALAVGTGLSWRGGNTGLAIGLGAAFVIVGGLVGLYFLDLFVWAPRREGARACDQLRQFREVERQRQDRIRQRERRTRG